MTCFPLYFVKTKRWEILYPESKEDIGHPEFFAKEVAPYLAVYHKVSLERLKPLCYSQVRGRYARSLNVKRFSLRVEKAMIKKGIPLPSDDKIYLGECIPAVVKLIKKHFPGIEIVHDDHHRRQEDDVVKFEIIIGQAR